MLKRLKLCASLGIALGSVWAVSPAMAQTATAPPAGSQQLERVEVTGSAIKRIDAETSVPVTVIKVDDLRKQGINSVEQIMANVSASQVTQTSSQVIGASTGGVSQANLRGIGSNKTLVLLNGRRIANSAFDAAAPDLNMIPFAALDRVEVLRDGASSLYGSDAVAGVINFITRKDYSGFTASAGYDSPQHPGGKSWEGSLGFGTGDIDKDHFNINGFVNFQQQNHIGGTDRNFNTRIPGGLSPTPFPANYFQGDASGNPAAAQAGGCPASTGLITDGGTGCQLATASFVDYIPATKRASIMLKGTFKLAESMELGLEYFGSKSQSDSQIAPVPYGGLIQNMNLPGGGPNPFYPGNGNFTPNIPLDPTYTTAAGASKGGLPGFVNVKWRDLANGPRADHPRNSQQRFVASLQGNVAAWDYQAAATYNNNLINDYISGYSDGPTITAGVLNGVINPFGDQTAAGAALIQGAARDGLLLQAKGETAGVDAHASRDLSDWFHAGRPAAIALGVEASHQHFDDHANASFASLVVASTGIDPATSNVGSRNIYAGYVELNVPVLKTLDVTGSLRYDKYSDFGNTTNPKVSFRFQPVDQVLLRGSASTGFRAPSLFEIHSGQAYTNTSQLDDPVRCPGGNPIAGASRATSCNAQFQALTGGNLNLQPEKSKNASLGIVVEPVRNLTLGVDYWWIDIKQTIGTIPDTTLFGTYPLFASSFHRLPDGTLSTDGSACPDPTTCGYVDLRTQNLGKTITDGFDFSGSYNLHAGSTGNFTFVGNSTYVMKYAYQDYTDGPYNQNVGVFVGTGPIFRWQQTVSAAWTLGPYGAGLTGHYKSGYDDQDPSNHVSSYTTFDGYGSWAPTKQLSFTLGIRNLFDREPPFSNQVFVFQAGYDPRFTDPTGRTYYVRGTYNY